MAKSRKDPRGRMLRKGESWREQDQRYTYTYTDPLGRRKWVYASDLRAGSKRRYYKKESNGWSQERDIEEVR